ncbi:MAG TPA: hypothetical protein VK205_11540 [Prolixibacteraceae bacterium]|nr:hypothetical protein [Prolixibacteraceae bacterium]
MAEDIFYFNPTCELAIANGSFSYMPPQLLRDFENDCAALPFVFASSNDFILTETKPSYEFLRELTDYGFQMPVFAPMKELMAGSSFNQLLPWGWSPAAHFILKSLKDKCSPDFKSSPVFNWHEMHKTLFERKTSLAFLVTLLENHPLNFFLKKECTGTMVTNMAEIEILLNKQFPLVLKAPLSSSGRGIQIIRKADLNTSNRQWISGVLGQQGYLVAEPYLDKRMDLSFQFHINDLGEPEYLGYSIFETNTNGQYKSTLIHPKISKLLPDEQFRTVNDMIEITAELITQNLSQSIFSTWHRGLMGIDAMIYKDEKDLKIQPCIEINSRMNMGILAMQAQKYLHPQAQGKFELFYGRKGAFNHFAQRTTIDRPLKLLDGQPFSGFLPLTEPDASKQFGAYLLLE